MRARRGTVDLVGEDDIGQDRARAEAEARITRIEQVDAGHVRGQKIGRELNAPECPVDAACDGLGEQRLAHAGNVFERDMPLAEQRPPRPA